MSITMRNHQPARRLPGYQSVLAAAVASWMLVVLAAHPVGAQDFVCGTQADTSRQSSYDVDPLQPTRALILFVKFQDDTQDPPCLLANWPSSLGDSIPAW